MTTQTIKKLLVANRGEIAIRVFRAASELGISTVAVYSYEDRYSLHRYKADEAYCIGDPGEPIKPYLDGVSLVALAKRVGADAIHPGYGFLSEREAFVRECETAGVIFVGPTADCIAHLGDKIAAKNLAKSVGVPTIEGATLAAEELPNAAEVAAAIGFPLLIKAAAGAGGRGMRIIRTKGEVAGAVMQASQEALQAFGDGSVFFERFIDNPKHIEVQLLGDGQGNLVHLFERDCSVQRRFQKVVEVAPAPLLSPSSREQLYTYALAIGQAVQYRNAGTVEFLVDQQENIFFIEVNPRIQVEHTVTEEVTGVDLVRAQLLIAAGHKLNDPCLALDSQESISCKGFAIQCRITTEDPTNDFRPDYGKIVVYRSPGGFGIRLDGGGAHAGATISPFFDSMLVKVTARGDSLKAAAERLSRALREFRIRGLKTNVAFLNNVVSHPDFCNGSAAVNFIADHPELLQFTRGRDRATRLLSYVAEVIVNGNSDVKPGFRVAKLDIPPVPKFDLSEILPGSRDRLLTLGRDEFCRWLREERSIQFCDTTMRDAHQSLLATRVRTRDLLAIAPIAARQHHRLFSMEVWGGATFDVALRFLHECPWERLTLLREAVPNILFQMLLRGANAVGYKAYPDNLVIAFVEEAAKAGIDIFRIFDSMNWLEGMQVSIDAVVKRTNALAEVCVCYTGDILDPARPKFNLQYYVDLARRIEDAGAHILCVKDMAGLLKPKAAEVLIHALRESIHLPIHLHTHDTAGVQTATYWKAIEAGVDVIDCAIAALSGLTSQPNLNSMVASLKGHEREPNLDVHSLNECSRYWEVVRSYYAPFESGLQASTAEVYRHEIPGGQYSNLRPQARSLGLEDRFVEITEQFKAVNDLLGDIVKVTPSSKVVGDMALFLTANNLTTDDVIQRGAELSFPDSFKELLRGDIGQQPGGFPPEVIKAVLQHEQPLKGRASDAMPPLAIEKAFSEFKQKFGEHWSYRDFLSYQMYPKVFTEYVEARKRYGRVAALPTPVFLYGLSVREECMVDIEEGKTLIISHRYTEQPDEDGKCLVHFRLNGQERTIEVIDRSVVVSKRQNRKVTDLSVQIGAPLQGRVSSLKVKKGDRVERGTPLFTIEAMKMETVVGAPRAGEICIIELEQGAMVSTDDVVLEMK